MMNPTTDDEKYKHYEDPPKMNIHDRLRSSKTLKDIMNYVSDTYPNWIKFISDGYSTDYPHLSESWIHVCTKISTEPAKILIVDFIPPHLTKKHSLISHFIDIFTVCGFVIRRNTEFQQCSCGLLLPTEECFSTLKHKPKRWLPHCIGCPAHQKEVEEKK